MVAGERFEAWCVCPACERFACHLLRRATVADNKLRHETRGIVGSIARFGWTTPTCEITEEQVRAAIQPSDVTREALRMLYVNTPGWSDEARRRQASFRRIQEVPLFEVIRTCECDHSWGQT